ncbi:hypothetical protein LPJ56_001802 [Coemansia sp. RSA 2599]|nr:hypothetical protein LPJ56_001802 [Coemansia sp. RSA 2599]
MQPIADPSLSADTHVLLRDLKHELKDWEAEFEKRNGRAATKDDMLQRPEIARKYKQYGKLKKQLVVGSTSDEKADLVSKPVVLDLETSSLKPPLKRKPKDMLSANEGSEPDLDESPGESKRYTRAYDLAELRNHCSISQATTEAPCKTSSRSDANSNKTRNRASDGSTDKQLGSMEPTLKRRCAGLLLSSRKQGRSSESTANARRAHNGAPLGSPESTNGPTLISTQDTSRVDADSSRVEERKGEETSKPAVTDEVAAHGTDSEEIDYRPLPSLVQQYTQPCAFSLQPNLSIRNLASSSSNSQHPGSPLLRSLNMMTMSEKEPAAGSVGISMPRFKARAGKLVKTTSIPLSAFDGKAKASFDPEPLQGHTSDGNEDASMHKDSASSAADLDASELVDESGSGDDYQSESSNGRRAQKKKTTQKRSTRRVKLKPVDKEGNALGTVNSRASGAQNLVSSNFYKVRLKSSRRAPKSSEERRTALYKRMVGKKGS